MKIYMIDHNSFRTHGTPWFKSAWASPAVEITCEKCNRSELKPSPLGHIDLEIDPRKGTFWPDAVGHGGGPRSLYVSDRVKEAWDRAGIKYGASCQVNVEGKFPKKLQNIPPPKYHYIIPNLGAKLDWERSGFENNGTCPACGRESFFRLNIHDPVYFIKSSWNGEDVFAAERSSARRYCTQRVKDLIEQADFSNFSFEEIGNSTEATQAA
jgi:hypothetical protein